MGDTLSMFPKMDRNNQMTGSYANKSTRSPTDEGAPGVVFDKIYNWIDRLLEKLKRLCYYTVVPRTIALVVLLLAFAPLTSKEFSDYYGDASEVFEDPGTGETLFPVLEIPLGGRAVGMGGAYTAVALDFGGIHSNPALTSMLSETTIAISHRNWIADSSVESAAYTQRFGDLGIGASLQYLHIPFTSYLSSGTANASAHISEGVVAANASYNFIPSYYFGGIAIGANLKGAFRLVPDSLAQNQSIFAGSLDLGIATSFNFLKPFISRSSNTSVGIALRNFPLHAMEEPLPTVASVGISYSPLEPLTLSADFNYPFVLFAEGAAKKWYFSAGINIDVVRFLSFQFGFSYGGANTKISAGACIEYKEVSLLANYTLDLTTQLTTIDRFSLEAKIKLGRGGRETIESLVDKYYLAGLEAYGEDDIEAAIHYWNAALNLNPNYEPAREFLDTVLANEQLREEMQEMSRLRRP